MARQKLRGWGAVRHALPTAGVAALAWACVGIGPVQAWSTVDGTLEVHGFVDSTTHGRAHGLGLSKQRFRGQLEFSKNFGAAGIFSSLSAHGIVRAVYDGVYDLNSDTYGDEAGGQVMGASTGIPTPNGPLLTPWGSSPVTAGNPALPGGGGFGFDVAANPNTGLRKVGRELGASSNTGQFGGGLELFTPVRPCNVDPRGCIDGYLDFDEDDLRFPEFRDDHRWLREMYVDATIPFENGNELNFRVGRQQVVWGRTDLFRVLDQVNPIDFSVQNIYEEFEDSRIPLGILSAEYRMGATAMFDDLNFQFLWNFEDFQPSVLGQGGQPYNILLAGDLFRALGNCWDNGCTVSNFAGLSPAGNLATDFPAHTLGIRQANVPDGNDQFGMRLEGVFKSVGFSVNALYFYQQLPSLHAFQPPAVNPFVGRGIPAAALPPFLTVGPETVFGQEFPRSYLPAFDIEFPRVLLVGASGDFYVDQLGSIPLKSVFRVEVAHTNGEEFPDTSKPGMYSTSRVMRWVVGWDRQTFFRTLNRNRAFLISAQVFGEHLLDHNLIETGTGSIGMPNWKDDFFLTLLLQTNYMNDRLNPRILTAYDVRAHAGVVGPQIEWLMSDNWQFILAANLKFGTARQVFDNNASANPYPPFTLPAGTCGPVPSANPPPCNAPTSSIGLFRGYEPLGRFRSGPIGMAQHEDELQLMVRFRF